MKVTSLSKKSARFLVCAKAVIVCAITLFPITAFSQSKAVESANKAAADMAKQIDTLQKAADEAEKQLQDISQKSIQANTNESNSGDAQSKTGDAVMEATTARALTLDAVAKAKAAKSAADEATTRVQAADKTPGAVSAETAAAQAFMNADAARQTADQAASQASAAKTKSDAAVASASDSLDPTAATKRNNFRYRLLGGYEGAIGNSASPKGQYYFEAFATTPLNTRGDRTWGFARITAAPTQVDAPISTFLPDLAKNLGNVNVNQIGHSGEFMFGWEHRFPLSYKVFDISPIVGLGGTTPINPQDNVDVFVNDENQTKSLYPSAVGKTYIAFVPPQRNGPYWQYVAGARFTTLENTESKIPEATFDLTLGQNQLITGGSFRGPVLRFDAMLNATDITNKIAFPIPLYFFVTGMWKTSRAGFSEPLILSKPSNSVPVPGDNVAIITTPPSSLDITRFGVGIDLAKLFAKPGQ
jgi:hypothetical protein